MAADGAIVAASMQPVRVHSWAQWDCAGSGIDLTGDAVEPVDDDAWQECRIPHRRTTACEKSVEEKSKGQLWISQWNAIKTSINFYHS